jgi:hypothetical protein
VAAARIDEIEYLGLQVFRCDDDYGLMKGLPHPDDYDLVMDIADKLVALFSPNLVCDPWRRRA